MDEQVAGVEVAQESEIEKIWARLVAVEKKIEAALKPQAETAPAPVASNLETLTLAEIEAQLAKHGIVVQPDTKAEVAAAKQAQGANPDGDTGAKV